MDIRFLESLIAVVEQGSISGAARQQNLTATAISQRIRALEADFCCELLIRTGHAAQPTKSCLDLLTKARDLVSASQALRRGVGSMSLSGPFRIGAIETILPSVVPSLVGELAKKAPQCDLRIAPGTSKQLLEMLEQKKIDLAICVAPPFVLPKSISQEVVALEPYLLVFPKSVNPTSQLDILKLPFILYDSTSWGGSVAAEWIYANNAGARILCELDAMQTIVEMVKSGLGASILPIWQSLSEAEDIGKFAMNPKVPDRRIVILTNQTMKNEPLFELAKSVIKTVAQAEAYRT